MGIQSIISAIVRKYITSKFAGDALLLIGGIIYLIDMPIRGILAANGIVFFDIPNSLWENLLGLTAAQRVVQKKD